MQNDRQRAGGPSGDQRGGGGGVEQTPPSDRSTRGVLPDLLPPQTPPRGARATAGHDKSTSDEVGTHPPTRSRSWKLRRYFLSNRETAQWCFFARNSYYDATLNNYVSF